MKRIPAIALLLFVAEEQGALGYPSSFVAQSHLDGNEELSFLTQPEKKMTSTSAFSPESSSTTPESPNCVKYNSKALFQASGVDNRWLSGGRHSGNVGVVTRDKFSWYEQTVSFTYQWIVRSESGNGFVNDVDPKDGECVLYNQKVFLQLGWMDNRWLIGGQSSGNRETYTYDKYLSPLAYQWIVRSESGNGSVNDDDPKAGEYVLYDQTVFLQLGSMDNKWLTGGRSSTNEEIFTLDMFDSYEQTKAYHYEWTVNRIVSPTSSPTTSPKPSHDFDTYLADEGTNFCADGYEQLASPTECEAYANHNGLLYRGADHYNNSPRGCYIWNGPEVYFNFKSPGAGNGIASPVCKPLTSSWTSRPSTTPSITMQPTVSSVPSQEPTFTTASGFFVDVNGRRRYPRVFDRPEENTLNFQPPPNCTSSERGLVGCVALPFNLSPLPPPDWHESLNYKPPTCKLNGAREQCSLGYPSSRKVYPPDLLSIFELELDTSTIIGNDRSGGETESVALADMDNDSEIDIILGFRDAPNQILYSNSNGGYNFISLPGGDHATTSVVIADINGDGRPDIVVGNLAYENQLLLNNGYGVFEVIELPGGSVNTRSIAIGDVDKDGDLDLLVGNERQSNILLLNKGDIFFEEIVIPETLGNTQSVAFGDMDNNDKVDLIFGNGDDPNQLLLNNGNLNTFDIVELPNGGEQYHTNLIVVGDINGDGELDLVIGTSAPGGYPGAPNVLLQNIGDVTFEAVELQGGNDRTFSISLADIDGNGLLDILIGNFNAMNYVLMNHGSDNLILNDLPGTAYHCTTSIAVANIGGNSLPLFVIGNSWRKGEYDQILRSPQGEAFAAIDLPYVQKQTKSVAAGDLTGNGHIDIVLAHYLQQSDVLLNEGENNITKPIELPDGVYIGRAWSVAVGDIDNDGFQDIVMGLEATKENIILFNKGNNSFTPYRFSDIIVNGGDSPFASRYVSIADIDGDGRMDIIEGNIAGQSNYVYFNVGNRTFESMALPDSDFETRSIIACDINGDNQLDLVIGNHNSSANQLLKNVGNRSFDVIILPGGDMSTSHIVVGDMDNNGHIDIVIINSEMSKLLLNYGAGDFNVTDLEKIPRKSRHASLGDFDGNGFMDIVIANDGGDNQILWNKGNARFETMVLPGGAAKTEGSSVLDFNGDGFVDIMFANYDEPNQVLLYDSFQRTCPNGGARLHSSSWCFHCPSYMGQQKLFGDKTSACVECIADYEQTELSTQCSSLACPFDHRPLGENKCMPCLDGTFYDYTVDRDLRNISTWNSTRCIDCPPGHYADGLIPAIRECFQCRSGSHQPDSGQKSCIPCEKGFFQVANGQDMCEACDVGGYCDAADTCGGGFTPCHAGTYNNEKGRSDASDCKKCPLGTFSTDVRASSVANCELCPAGSYTDKVGQTSCQLCPLGSYQSKENQTSCLSCPPGTYANNPGLVECSRCPFRLHSTDGSDMCSFCDEGFYLSVPNAEKSAIFEKPDAYCDACPTHARCLPNSTLQTIIVPPDFWRDSLDTASLYRCDYTACLASQSQKSISAQSQESILAPSQEIVLGTNCISGHTGPLCQVCYDNSKYFTSEGNCEACPSLWRLTIPATIIVCIIGALVTARYVAKHSDVFGDFVNELSRRISNIGLQVKFKILISFYQIIATLNDVYGVSFHEKMKYWQDLVSFFNFGLLDICGIPGKCIGSMKRRLIFGGLWPFIVIVLCFGGITLYTIYMLKMKATDTSNHAGIRKQMWLRLVTISIFILYVVLPSIVKTIFEPKKCRSFDSNDAENQVSSYLIADWSVRCDDENNDYQAMQYIFWIYFVLWLIIVPLSFVGILMRIQNSVQTQQITPFAKACSFLWRDYTEESMYWEACELVRKIFLTGLVMFVDTEEGSNKIMRLILAIIISTFYLTIVLYIHPYRKDEDQNLALMSSFLLICCLVLGISIQLCSDDNGRCETLIGRSLTYYRASLLAILVIFFMFVVLLLAVGIAGKNQTADPAIKLVSTKHAPYMDLPEDCQYHAFVSHVWSTGQDKTHAMVRKIQVYLPGIKIWLDVENLSSMDSLETSVQDSAVFVIMYTDGYFRSKNCRREVCEAVRLQKPVIIMYEGDDSVIENIKERCLEYCMDVQILDYILDEDPLLWLGASSRHFSVSSVKQLSARILSKLPRYIRRPDLLCQGLKVAGELEVVDLPAECTLLCSEYNSVAKEVAEEVGAMSTNAIAIEDMKDYLRRNPGANDKDANFFLLYLNDQVFNDTDNMLEDHVKTALDNGIKIILVHETDIRKGGMPFAYFFSQTPRELIASPYNLFGDIATTLYSTEEYRGISLRLILMIMRDALPTSPRATVRLMPKFIRDSLYASFYRKQDKDGGGVDKTENYKDDVHEDHQRHTDGQVRLLGYK